jgi:hypothetical protein
MNVANKQITKISWFWHGFSGRSGRNLTFLFVSKETNIKYHLTCKSISIELAAIDKLKIWLSIDLWADPQFHSGPSNSCIFLRNGLKKSGIKIEMFLVDKDDSVNYDWKKKKVNVIESRSDGRIQLSKDYIASHQYLLWTLQCKIIRVKIVSVIGSLTIFYLNW